MRTRVTRTGARSERVGVCRFKVEVKQFKTTGLAMLAVLRSQTARRARFGWRRSYQTAQFVFPEGPVALTAELRADAGSVASKRCRARGFVPGVLYGIDEDGIPRKDLIQVPHAEVHRCMTQLQRSMVSTVFEVALGDRRVRAVMRELPLHPSKHPATPRAGGAGARARTGSGVQPLTGARRTRS